MVVTWDMKDIWQTGGWIQAVALSGVILFCYWLLVFAEALTFGIESADMLFSFSLSAGRVYRRPCNTCVGRRRQV